MLTSMAERQELPDVSTRLRRGLHTSVVDNSSAFGFSITITASFGVIQLMLGSPQLAEIFGFAVAAAVAFTVLQAAASGGFRRTPEAAPREVVMLGTALNFVSVGVGVGVATLVAVVFSSAIAWPLGAFLAASSYVLTEALEITAAARVERMLGDRRAETATE